MIRPVRRIDFGDFRLDLEAERLWRGEVERPLRAKSFAVLRHLVLNRSRLVTKEELFRACWSRTAVSDSVLRASIYEIRGALGDDAASPGFVTTVGRRGYRFEASPRSSEAGADGFVGRAADLRRLRDHLSRARDGRRQIVFVTGEPGIGKTALLDRFVEELRTDGRDRVAVGQCVEVVGGREAYLPLLDCLGRLCGEADGREVLATLDRFAPSWLLQMPALLDAGRAEALARRVPTPNRERMLRELGEALEALARERALALVLEDLHWSDASTVDALAVLAQRTTPARLLIVGSYRPVGLVLADHALKPLKQSLQARSRCTELALELLTPSDVGGYLAHRLSGHPVDAALAADVHRATDGNPLFMTATVDYLVARSILAVRDGSWRLARKLGGVVPESLRALVERQLDDLEESERRVLDAASVVGVEFAVALVAAATQRPLDDVEQACARLAAHAQLLAATGIAVWPDGTATGTYAFGHALYREIVHQRLPAARRRRLHRVVAERLDAGYAGRSGDVAAALAFHFEEAGDDVRAARYHGEAAAAARARHAEREVAEHLEAALERLARCPESLDRSQTELAHLLELAGAKLAVQSYGSRDAPAAYERARVLARNLGVVPAEVVANGGLYTHHVMRGELRTARGIAEELVATAVATGVPFFAVIGHTTLGSVLFNLAAFAEARAELERAHAAWEPGLPRLPLDQAVLHRTILALTLLHQGLPAAGADWLRRSLAHAATVDDAFNLSYAHELAAQYHATAGDRDAARRHAETAIGLATEHGFPGHLAVAMVMRGWAVGDAAAIRDGLGAYERLGQRIATTLFRALLAETHLAAGEVDEASAAIGAALAFAEASGEHRHLAELHRLRGECCLRRIQGRHAGSAAEACFERALTTAREQGAALWALRAATSLARLRQHGRRAADARRLLEQACAAIGAGSCPDLVRAREVGASSRSRGVRPAQGK
jgi:DNA-binding winged helix-turn-helix (wHTH) protein/tetratricopeptide (TPR) repeat protein